MFPFSFSKVSSFVSFQNLFLKVFFQKFSNVFGIVKIEGLKSFTGLFCSMFCSERHCSVLLENSKRSVLIKTMFGRFFVRCSKTVFGTGPDYDYDDHDHDDDDHDHEHDHDHVKTENVINMVQKHIMTI